jgi:SNF2 family DNA or RNA helicase
VVSLAVTKAALLNRLVKQTGRAEDISIRVGESRKLVIIARLYRNWMLLPMLEKKRINYSLIKGGVKDRDEQVVRFQMTPMSYICWTGGDCGIGITLTAASTMVFYSLDYSMSNFEQCKARIHRAGQRMPCTYIYLTAQGPVDEKVLKALKNKANLAKTLVDDYRYGNNPFI